MGHEIHVVPEEERWAVEQGVAGIGSLHETKEEAMAEARELAVEGGATVVVHGSDGQIRDREDPAIIRSKEPT
jgi:diacylglycerol kinase family enzyme